MIYAIVDSYSDEIKNLKDVCNQYSLRKDFDESESFTKILLEEVRKKLGTGNVPESLKSVIGMNTIVSKVSRNDFCVLSSIDNSKNKGGIRLISVPDLKMENHLVIWSETYGVMAMSRDPFSPEVEKLEGSFFLLFECMPPFVIGVKSEKDFGFSIMKEMKDRDYAEKQAHVLGDLATYVFPEWEKYHKEESIEAKTEFCFLSQNNDIEC